MCKYCSEKIDFKKNFTIERKSYVLYFCGCGRRSKIYKNKTIIKQLEKAPNNRISKVGLCRTGEKNERIKV